MAGGRPLAFDTVKELEDAVNNYFDNDANVLDPDGKEIFLPTMSGLALSLGVSRQTVVNYSNKEEFFDTINKARGKIENFIERRLYGNNVTGCIFNLKNNFGWKDKTEVDNTSSDGSMTPTKIVRQVIDAVNDKDT